ncbi:sulfatase family protein [Lunatibacter salilacus]|uniref:sulfatase family protein n=1 Tax=Lunatibacter salilacus TaxID=2483804 RepID=UPI00131DADE5|nr:sulfatase [Lunatibacter salilacus]
MKNRKIIVVLFFCFLASGLQAADPRPNIVYIIADDIGWDDLGCYGHPLVSSPNIDRMAQQGIKFDNFYLTTSSCSPSRTSIISGRYPHNTGAAELHTPLPEEMVSFPELLKDAGYFTAQAGKWHMGDAPRSGFDVIHDRGASMGDGGEGMWVQTLNERPRDKPFFMWFAALDAHRPWGPNDFSGTHDPLLIKPPVYLADSLPTKKDLAQYYDEITRFDFYVGEVERELELQGVLDNTVIIIMSDNGRPFPRSKTRMYDSGIKSPLIILLPEGIKSSPNVSKSLISSIDIAPTILDLAGIEVGPSFQGKSFTEVLSNPKMEFRNFVFAEHNWHDHEAYERMVRTKDYLYVLNLRPNLSLNGPADSNKSDSYADLKRLRDLGKLSPAQSDIFSIPRPFEQLFFVADDYDQLINIASVPKHKEKLREMRDILDQWRKETLDTEPDNLTGDWYDKETGNPLDKVQTRGSTPGGQAAMKTNQKGPF